MNLIVLIISLLCAATAKHTFFVIDVSGSMDVNGRLEGAKAGIKQALNKLARDGSDTVSLMSFNHGMEMHFQHQLPFLINRDAFIDKMVPNGNTALYDAVEYARSSSMSNASYTEIIVFTDGEDNASRISEAEGRMRMAQSAPFVTMRMFEILSSHRGDSTYKNYANMNINSHHTFSYSPVFTNAIGGIAIGSSSSSNSGTSSIAIGQFASASIAADFVSFVLN